LEICEKLLELRTSSGKSQAEFAKLAGVSQRTWSSYESGQTTPKMGVLWALAANGYPIEGLTTSGIEDLIDEGKITKAEFQKRFELARAMAEKMPPNTPIDNEWAERVNEEYKTQVMVKDDKTEPMIIDSESETWVSLFKFSHGKPMPIPAYKADPNALVMLPIYSQRASAGPGQSPTQMAEIEAYLPILYELLNGSNHKNCGAVRVTGDSMTDMTIFNGDLVVFDRTKLEGDGVYVISILGDVRVKRIEYRAFEKKIIIRSENQKRYPDPEIISYEQAQEMLVIHGKIVCWVHQHPY
jgi:transcriptional regulator with XRE-family HTH domain